jgi:hypothetical protein
MDELAGNEQQSLGMWDDNVERTPGNQPEKRVLGHNMTIIKIH